MKRKHLCTILSALLLINVSVACSSPTTNDLESSQGNDTSNQSSSSANSSDKITIWAFADPHATYFEWVTEEYKSEHPDLDFAIEIMDNSSLQDRLSVIISAGGDGSPDLIDIEQGQFSRYMSPDRMCFEPLNDYMDKDDVLNKMVEARLSLYQYQDSYYGLEHALCPITMAYRPDLFEENNIEVPTTWEEYKQAAEKFKQKGIYITAEADMATGGGLDDIGLFLRSAGKDIVADDGTPYFGSELKMLLEDFKYMQQNGMMFPYETEEDRWTQFKDDKVATYFTPDWAAGWLRDNVPEQSGQWAMTALPQITSDASTTSCWGGTGLAMMRYTNKDKDLLWDFMYFSMVDTENCVEKYKMINLYPPVYEAMILCNGPVEYYNNQDLGALYQQLAEEMPVQNQAMWRNNYVESFKTYAYDYYEDSMTADDLMDAIASDVNEYIANGN